MNGEFLGCTNLKERNKVKMHMSQINKSTAFKDAPPIMIVMIRRLNK
jgi:hypothetical protein